MYGSTRAQANYQQRHITQQGDPFSRQPLAKLALHLMIELKVVWHRFLRILGFLAKTLYPVRCPTFFIFGNIQSDV
jgi:hypothetical protein